MKKVFIEMVCKFDKLGNVIPLRITWPDGRVFEVDKVISIERAAAFKIGGYGIRYTVRIRDKETFIWRDGDTWFMEGK
jgi:hypothetical protein